MPSDPLDSLQAKRFLGEINQFILDNAGEIIEVPGKLSLVWMDPVYDQNRFLAVKAAGEGQILVNGRRYPATEAGLKQGLKACLAEMNLIK